MGPTAVLVLHACARSVHRACLHRTLVFFVFFSAGLPGKWSRRMLAKEAAMLPLFVSGEVAGSMLGTLVWPGLGTLAGGMGGAYAARAVLEMGLGFPMN